jgi:hypothetical protein
LTFNPGETAKKITVSFRQDSLDEPDESLYVELFNPAYARIGDHRGYGIIPDDDGPVSVSIHALGSPGTFFTSLFEPMPVRPWCRCRSAFRLSVARK